MLKGFVVDNSSGAIIGPITGLPPIRNHGAFEVLADPSDKFLYVRDAATGGSSGMVTYTINADGSITLSPVLSDSSSIGGENVLGP
jgi:hypothetical protein